MVHSHLASSAVCTGHVTRIGRTVRLPAAMLGVQRASIARMLCLERAGVPARHHDRVNTSALLFMGRVDEYQSPWPCNATKKGSPPDLYWPGHFSSTTIRRACVPQEELEEECRSGGGLSDEELHPHWAELIRCYPAPALA